MKKNTKAAIILGTRPEIIKMSPIIDECSKQKLNYFVIHTNQHYSENLDKYFFSDLNLDHPKYNLGSGSGTHAQETARMMIGIEKILIEEKPDVVLVEGDTNTVLAGALAACKLHIKIGHIEAGLRSYSKEMPEEINRILVDHCSDFLFAPTKQSKKILLKEGIPKEKIFITGNTIVDAVYRNLKIISDNKKALSHLGLFERKYFLMTLHRQENVDNKERFANVLKGIQKVARKFSLPVIFPIHPRSKKMLKEFGLETGDNIKIIEPLGYFDFLQLQKNAKLIFTDSGGLQEESCILHVPCVTLRDNTERPETIEVGSNILAGTEIGRIVDATQNMLDRETEWDNPFGDGNSSKIIIRSILQK
ncbi:MAG: UDP-N-acetylglucosamine 2-epimerase (non-hydrolyzing) [bacterium]